MNILEHRKFLVDALNAADSIAIKYKLLKTLEISNLKSQMIFSNAKMSLQNALCKENELYKTKLLGREAESMLHMLCESYGLNPNATIEDLIHGNLSEYIGAERVLVKLLEKLNSSELYYQSINDSLPHFLKNNLSASQIKSQIKYNLLFQSSIQDDYYLILMSFLDYYLKDTGDKFRDQIIHKKYLLPFLYTNLEKNFLDNDFITPDSIYLAHKMYGDLFFPDFVQSMQVSSIIYEKFSSERERLLMMSDDSIKRDDFDAFLATLFLRSSTILLDSDFIEASCKNFEQSLREDCLAYQNRKEAVNLMKEVYVLSKKDKSLHKYLSLKPPY